MRARYFFQNAIDRDKRRHVQDSMPLRRRQKNETSKKKKISGNQSGTQKVANNDVEISDDEKCIDASLKRNVQARILTEESMAAFSLRGCDHVVNLVQQNSPPPGDWRKV